MKYRLAAVAFLAFGSHAYAWDGVNIDTGTSITIDDGSDLSEGNTLDAFDGETGDEFQIIVDQTSQIDGGTEIQVTNATTNQTEIYDFPDQTDAAPQ